MPEAIVPVGDRYPRGCRLALLLISCFLVNMVLFGTLDCFGLVFDRIKGKKEWVDVPKVQMALVPSLLFSLPYLLAPPCNWLIDRLGAPMSLTLSSLLAASGLFLSTIPSIPLWALVILLGCVTGCGLSIGFLLLDNVISRVIPPLRQDIYNCFIQAGGCLGILFLPEITAVVSKNDPSNSNSLYLFGSLHLGFLLAVPAFCGLDFKAQLGQEIFAAQQETAAPLPMRRRSLEMLDETGKTADPTVPVPKATVWRKFVGHLHQTWEHLSFPPFSVFLLFRLMFSLSNDSTLLFYSPKASEVVGENWALVGFGLARIVGLLAFTCWSPRKDFGHTAILCGIGCIVAGVGLCVLNATQNSTAIVTVGCLWGFGSSATTTLEANLIRRIMRSRFNEALHLVYMANGLGSFFGPILGYHMLEIYNDKYPQIFLASGLGVICAGALSFLVALLLAKTEPFQKTPIDHSACLTVAPLK